MSLRARLALLAGAAVACAVVIGAIVTYGVVHDLLYQQVDDSLRSRVAGLTALPVGFGCGDEVRRPADPDPHPWAIVVAEHPLHHQTGRQSGGEPRVHAKAAARNRNWLWGTSARDRRSGHSAGCGGELHAVRDHARRDGAIAGRKPTTSGDADRHRGCEWARGLHVRTDTINGTPVRIATAKMTGGLAVMVARPLDETDSVLANLRQLLFLIGAAGVVLAAGLGVLVARATMRPVRRLMAATDHVAGTRDLTRRIDVKGGSELDHLAMSFNRMLEALERSETVQRQLVADASHELRTPLTSLRTNIEVLAHDRRMPAPERKRLLASVVGQLERLTDLVTGLIDLARGSEPVNAQADIALDDVVDLVVGNARAHWPKLTFAVITDGSKVHGDAALLERAVGNLVDNAAKWSPAEGTVDVSVEHGEVRVRDHGPGVAASERGRVFDRFWRSPTARQMPGSGLGLAIVRQVAQAHKGEVTVEAADGGGALFVMRLPLSTS